MSKIDSTPYINQYQHNLEFHNGVCDKYPDTYYDWKITLLFYCAYHLLQALAAHKNVVIGNYHKDILWNINPKNANRKLQIKQDVFYAFDQLFEYSRSARYNGFTDFEDFQSLKKADYEDAVKRFEYFRRYITSNGVAVV